MERNYSVVLVDIESPYGTDAAPAAATEAIIVLDEPTFEVLGETKERSVPLKHFGKIAGPHIGTGLKLSFKTELKGSGAAGTASRYGPLWRACNLTQALVADTSASYTPHSNLAGESVSLYFYAGTTLHKILGAVGNAVINCDGPNEVVTVSWDFTGVYAGDHASTVTEPTPTHETVSPIIWKGAQFVYNSVTTFVIDKMSLDLGNTISKRPDANNAIGISRYFISQRDSKGSMSIEKEPLATINPWTLWDAATQANIVNNPTGTAGNIFSIAVTGATLDIPKYGVKETIRTWDLSFMINPTLAVGNNELVLTFT